MGFEFAVLVYLDGGVYAKLDWLWQQLSRANNDAEQFRNKLRHARLSFRSNSTEVAAIE